MIVWYGPKWHRRQNLSRHQRERSHRQSHDSRLLPAAGGAGGVIFGNVGQWAAAGAVGGAVGSRTCYRDCFNLTSAAIESAIR